MTFDDDIEALHGSCATMEELLAGIRQVLTRHGRTDAREYQTTLKALFRTTVVRHTDGSLANKWRRKFLPDKRAA